MSTIIQKMLGSTVGCQQGAHVFGQLDKVGSIPRPLGEAAQASNLCLQQARQPVAVDLRADLASGLRLFQRCGKALLRADERRRNHMQMRLAMGSLQL